MKEKKSIQQVMSKENPEFVAEVSGLSVESLNSRLADVAKGIQAVDDSKDADEQLQDARAHAVELNAPYVDAKKALRHKSKYIIELIKEKS